MKILITILLSAVSVAISAQHLTLEDTLSRFLDETKETTLRNKDLWRRDIYAPILFVNEKTRVVYGNEPDANGSLTKRGKLYVGELPKSINIANTALNWSGKRWAMIMLPLSKDKNERLNLITHELFHQAQSILNLNTSHADNNHLDTKNGRIYLRLELEALKKTLLSKKEKDARAHISAALIFRRARYNLFSKADSTENLLELNEGLAEYTGLVMSERSDQQIIDHFNQSLTQFLTNETFVRSFAYQTIPMYGYLLSKKDRYWNKNIKENTNLTKYFQDSFGVKRQNDDQVKHIFKSYNGETILAEEERREKLTAELIRAQTEKFVTNPHFDLAFEKMSISFDPRNVISLDTSGTVYPTIRVTDHWGILTVENGALLSPNWSKITVTVPTDVNSNIVRGDGWTLELNVDLYTIRQDIYSKNYYLTKK
jgi:hypothetical protein